MPIDFSFYVDRKANHFLSYGHINIYTPSTFRFLLKSENFMIIEDKCYLYEKEILDVIFLNDKKGYRILKIKHFILKYVPYLLGIKPSSYVVLTT